MSNSAFKELKLFLPGSGLFFDFLKNFPITIQKKILDKRKNNRMNANGKKINGKSGKMTAPKSKIVAKRAVFTILTGKKTCSFHVFPLHNRTVKRFFHFLSQLLVFCRESVPETHVDFF